MSLLVRLYFDKVQRGIFDGATLSSRKWWGNKRKQWRVSWKSVSKLSSLNSISYQCLYRYNTYSVSRISFKEEDFIIVVRSETNTMSDFISSCGGLFGLFMGASVLSIVEMVYYFTLRLYFKLKRRQTVQPVAVIQVRSAPVGSVPLGTNWNNDLSNHLEVLSWPKISVWEWNEPHSISWD